MTIQMEWPYFKLKDGIIVDENGIKAFSDKDQPIFANIEQAEQWLVDMDYRGNVTELF